MSDAAASEAQMNTMKMNTVLLLLRSPPLLEASGSSSKGTADKIGALVDTALVVLGTVGPALCGCHFGA
jgi:hypothetical protein